MTNSFNKHDFIENQAKLDFFDMLERNLKKKTYRGYRFNSHLENLLDLTLGHSSCATLLSSNGALA
jgi:hypothetical protein